MTGQECVTGCGRPASDFLCPGCVAELAAVLRELVSDGHGGRGLLAELDITLSRQDVMATSPGLVSHGAADGLPFRAMASVLSDSVAVVITTWARDLHERNPHLRPPAGSTTRAAAWLAGLPNLLALHPAADELFGDVTGVVAQIRAYIDRRADRVYSGPCGSQVDAGPCPGHLYARSRHGRVRCPACGTEHEVDERRAWMIDYALDLLVTATVALGWARLLMDHVIPPGTWRSWVSRRRILAHGCDALGRPVYRFGDVCDLVAEHLRRRHVA